MAYNTLSLAEKITIKAIQVGECLIWQGQKDKRGHTVKGDMTKIYRKKG